MCAMVAHNSSWEPSSPTDRRWNTLLLWLKSHGMDVTPDHLRVECKARPGAGNGLFAIDQCPAGTKLFTVPASALLNITTLPPHPVQEDGTSLSATQLISLHLFLHRPEGEQEESKDPLFGPYISIFPRDFDSHPLTWVTATSLPGREDAYGSLLRNLPPCVTVALKAAKRRFIEDYSTIMKYLRTYPDIVQTAQEGRSTTSRRCVFSDKTLMDMLWAWLNVNTRCIHHQIKTLRSDPDNITLCPVLDMANHRFTPPHIYPAIADPKNLPAGSWVLGNRDLSFISPREGTIQAGAELYLRYGNHSNRTLFVEYGFIDDATAEGEVDVQDLIEALFEEKGALGVWMREILDKAGYWGDWTLHLTDSHAHPSFRLITALRLFSAFSDLDNRSESERQDVLASWRATVMGRADDISPQNERDWRATLLRLCYAVIKRAKAGKEKLAQLQVVERVDWMKRNIGRLWNEELTVASAVVQSIDRGVTF